MAALAHGALVSSVSNVSKEVEGAVENKKISHGIPKDQESECNMYIYIYVHVKWRKIQITLPVVAALAHGALVSSVSNVSKEVEGAVENKKISHGMPKDQESECNTCIYIYIYMYMLNEEKFRSHYL